MKTKIESSIMTTCNECAKFGKIQREPAKPRRSKPFKRVSRTRVPSEEVIEDYNAVIRDAREKRGWSREELAEKLYEKASVVSRIETGKMIPDIKLARKLEKTLNIKLIEKQEHMETEEMRSAASKGATIGDIARIKKS